MKNYLTEILNTKTLKDSGVTFLGTIINGALGLAFYFLLARYLGPSSFGIFSFFVAALSLLGDIANVGSDTGTVRFVGKYFNTDRVKALKFLKLSLKVRVISCAIIIAIGWFTAPYIIVNLVDKPELIVPTQLAIVGVGGYLLFAFVTYSLQAVQKYWIWSALNISTNFLRLMMIIVLMSLGILSNQLAMTVYIAMPILGFFVGLIFLPKFLNVKGENEVAVEFFKYNIWVALFSLIAAVGGKMDTFLSTRLLSLYEVGIYSSALQLSSIVPQIVFAFGTVVAPKLAGFDSIDKAKIYLKKIQIFTVGLSILGLLVGIPLSRILIPFFYGQDYSSAFKPFAVLLLAQAIFLISVPSHTSILYFFEKPKFFVWLSIFHLLIISTMGWYLISRFGYMGAAYTILIGNVFNFIVPGVWVLKKLSKQTK